MTVMRKLVIDTDPGLDDAVALLLALAYPETLELAAVTTVAGNQTIEKVTGNALKLLSFAGARVPVASGACRPLIREPLFAARIHGETGLGDVSLAPPLFAAESGDAQDLLARTLSASAEPVMIAPIGPLTNIALLLRAHPELKAKIGLISLMGGSISTGNITSAAEFNIYVDPEAAREVFASGLPLVMSGLEVTLKALITNEELRALGARGRASALAAGIMDCYADRYRRAGYPGAAIHDACAIAYLIRPEIFSGEKLHVEVETAGELTRGMTVADRRPGSKASPNVLVLTDVDRAAFIELLFEAFARLDGRLGGGTSHT